MKRVEDAKELVRRRIHTYQRKKRKYDRKEDKMTNNGRQNTTHRLSNSKPTKKTGWE